MVLGKPFFLIHKELMGTYCVPGTILDTVSIVVDKAVNKRNASNLWNLHSLGRRMEI